MQAKTFFTVAAGFLLGIFLHSLIKFGIYEIVFVSLLGLVFLLLSFLKENLKNISLIAALLFFSLSAGLIRYNLAENSADTLLPFVGETQFYEGVVNEEPSYGEKSIQLVILVSKAGENLVEDLALAIIPAGQKFSYGERIQIFGELTIPENFETETGRIFDYKNYLSARGINYVFLNPHINLLAEGEGNKIKENIFFVKNKFVQSINENIAAPESSLLVGLLLGVKESLGKEWDEIFRRAGLSHIVVLSGYNLTIVAIFIMGILSWLPFRPRLLAAAGSIIAFAVMTGGSATVVRASAMALLVIFAQVIRRRYDITRALVLAGVLMVLISPKILVFDISFQLSFLATLGLIYITPAIEKFFKWIPEKLAKFKEIVLATISTQIFVTPFLLFSMGQFSAVALLANLLVLPLVPLSMLFGFLTGLIGLLSNALATPFSLLTYALLHAELVISKFFANLPFASFSVPVFSPWWLLVIYVALTYGIYVLQKKNTVKQFA